MFFICFLHCGQDKSIIIYIELCHFYNVFQGKPLDMLRANTFVGTLKESSNPFVRKVSYALSGYYCYIYYIHLFSFKDHLFSLDEICAEVHLVIMTC